MRFNGGKIEIIRYVEYKTYNCTGPGFVYKIFRIVEVSTVQWFVYDYTRTNQADVSEFESTDSTTLHPVSLQFPLYVDLVYCGGHFTVDSGQQSVLFVHVLSMQ